MDSFWEHILFNRNWWQCRNWTICLFIEDDCFFFICSLRCKCTFDGNSCYCFIRVRTRIMELARKVDLLVKKKTNFTKVEVFCFALEIMWILTLPVMPSTASSLNATYGKMSKCWRIGESPWICTCMWQLWPSTREHGPNLRRTKVFLWAMLLSKFSSESILLFLKRWEFLDAKFGQQIWELYRLKQSPAFRPKCCLSKTLENTVLVTNARFRNNTDICL